VGTGGDYNATGGTGGSGANAGGGGGGGAATRAGNGGNGANGTATDGGAGGGTGGNNASGTTPGIAATSVNGSAYSLTTFASTVTFAAGYDVFATFGGSGADALNNNSGFGTTFTIGSVSASIGARGGQFGTTNLFPGARGHVTIVEIF
jgi:hypothetical protein